MFSRKPDPASSPSLSSGPRDHWTDGQTRGAAPKRVCAFATRLELIAAISGLLLTSGCKGQAAGPLPTPAPEEVPALLELGKQLHVSHTCNTCHSLDGSQLNGPSFKGMFGTETTLVDGTKVVRDVDYLVESIRDPGAQMVKGYKPLMNPYPNLDERSLQALIELIKSVK